jgi:ABC-type multidrug transport system fused ATPase/permease subunit
VGLGGWLERQPDGLDAPVEGSDQMSAGEAQLIGVTRLLVRDRRLIVLDAPPAELSLDDRSRLGRMLRFEEREQPE